MLREMFASGNFTLWGIISLVIFFVVFVGTIVWIFRKGAKRQYDYMSQLPLENDESLQQQINAMKQKEEARQDGKNKKNEPPIHHNQWEATELKPL